MSISFPYNKEYSPAAPFVEATISAENDMFVHALLDTGADGTMIPERVLNEIKAPHIRSQRLRGVTGYPIIVELHLVEVRIGTFSMPGIQAIASRDDEIIIGRDVLQHLIVTLDGIGSVCEIS